MSYWKFGKQYAGMTPKGKRFVEKTRAKAIERAGKSQKTQKKTSKSKSSVKKDGVKKTGKRKFTLPLAAVIPIAAVSVHVAQFPGDLTDKMHEANRIFTGYDIRDGTWDYRRMSFGILPIVVGLIIHKIAGKLGLNRMLGQAGVPIVRV